MTFWIAWLRGVNVGGANRLPMKPLAEHLARQGWGRVRTYIQSGNLVFEHETLADDLPRRLARRMAQDIESGFGLRLPVWVMPAEDLAAVVRDNPFPEAVADLASKALHVFFLAEAPSAPDAERLNRLCLPGERWCLRGRVCYLDTPGGLSDSKVAAQLERALGVAATARNWRTVGAVLALAT